MTTEIPSGFVPLDKVLLSGDMKPSSMQPKKSVELTEKSELLPSSDRVQISEEIEQAHSNTYQLTVDKHLNEYILALKQAEVDENQKLEIKASETTLMHGEMAHDTEVSRGHLDIRA
jgi:hypothetical protein